MGFETPQPQTDNPEKTRAELKQEQQKEYDLNDLPPNLEGRCLKQYLLDLAQNQQSSLLEGKMGIKLNRQEILKSSPAEIEEVIKDTKLEKLLYKEGIVEAYEEIINNFNEGKKPTITSEDKYLYNLTKNGINAEELDTYDNRKVIVGQIGKTPLKADERLVLEIDSEPGDVIPRNTGEKYDEFQFNGTVIFQDSAIPPERITLVSAPPEVELPKGVELPAKLSELKEYYH